MPADRPYTSAEWEAVAGILAETHRPRLVAQGAVQIAAEVLDAAAPLIAARTRAEVAEEIAADLASRAPGAQPNRYGLDRETATERRVFMRAAGIARIHATTEEDPWERTATTDQLCEEYGEEDTDAAA